MVTIIRLKEEWVELFKTQSICSFCKKNVETVFYPKKEMKMKTKMQDVKSSNIKSIGHDGESILTIDFNNHTRYYFQVVPPNIFVSMLNSDSVGSFFHANIKNKYESVRVIMPVDRETDLTHSANMVK